MMHILYEGKKESGGVARQMYSVIESIYKYSLNKVF